MCVFFRPEMHCCTLSEMEMLLIIDLNTVSGVYVNQRHVLNNTDYELIHNKVYYVYILFLVITHLAHRLLELNQIKTLSRQNVSMRLNLDIINHRDGN